MESTAPFASVRGTQLEPASRPRELEYADSERTDIRLDIKRGVASRHFSQIGEREQSCMGDVSFQRTIRGQISADPKLASDRAAAVVLFGHIESPPQYYTIGLAEVRVHLYYR